MEQPSVGRIVHFVGQGRTRNEVVCRAAIVVAVRDDESVGLCVFNPRTPLFKQGVPLDEETKKLGTWHFPERVEAPSPADQVAGDEP